jgi:hypothetical protein
VKTFRYYEFAEKKVKLGEGWIYDDSSSHDPPKKRAERQWSIDEIAKRFREDPEPHARHHDWWNTTRYRNDYPVYLLPTDLEIIVWRLLFEEERDRS